MHHNRSTQTMTAFSLVKSKEVLDKYTHKISSIESNRQTNKMAYLQSSSKKIAHYPESKMQQTFLQILNTPTLIPLSAKTEPAQKENGITSSLSSLSGAKALMYNYWQRNKKVSTDGMNKKAFSRTFQSRRSESKLPLINSNTPDYKLPAFIRAKEKEKQLGIGYKEQFLKEEFHIAIKINDFKCQNDGKLFLKFQKTYYQRWEEIASIVRALQKFAQHYKIASLVVQTASIFDLIERVKNGQKMTAHDLLGCCEHPEDISEQNRKQSGIRFYGKRGMVRAVILIQSHLRRWRQVKKFKIALNRWRKAIKIQQEYRCYLLHKSTKQLIFERQMQKLKHFQHIQKQFVETYRRKEISARLKYEIHIPSHNMNDWQKISVQKYIEKQNSELCRIFKVALSNSLIETRIIYVSPISLTPEILNYYKKLLKLGSSEQKIDSRITFIFPQLSDKLPSNPALTQQLYYCPKSLNKIRKIIKDQYAYIVPSNPSNDYIHLCNWLNVPLYSSLPQQMLFLSTRSGCKTFQENLCQSKEEGFGILPYAIDIYNESNLLNELTNLIYRYPYVRRWVLKIDNESGSRGLATIDIFKMLGKKRLSKIGGESKNQQKAVREEIYTIMQTALVVDQQERIIPVDKRVYRSQSQYLNHFYTRGGVIEAAINNFQTDLQNSCFTVQIEPDGEWKFLCSYFKLTNKHRTVGSYFDSNLIKPPLQISNIIQRLKQQKYFGYFTFQFLSIPAKRQKTMTAVQNRTIYLNSIECHLNEYSAAHYLKNFISKQSNALYIPLLQHPAIKELRIQTFFHLCRLQNISFDIENKIGNVFTFVDGLESACIGIMTFNGRSRQDCYAHTAEVLQFLTAKLHQLGNKNTPSSFYRVKNAVNGYLNCQKKNRFQSQKTLDRPREIKQ